MSTYNLTLAEALSGRGEAKIASTLPLQTLETFNSLLSISKSRLSSLNNHYQSLSDVIDGTTEKFKELQNRLDAVQINKASENKTAEPKKDPEKKDFYTQQKENYQDTITSYIPQFIQDYIGKDNTTAITSAAAGTAVVAAGAYKAYDLAKTTYQDIQKVKKDGLIQTVRNDFTGADSQTSTFSSGEVQNVYVVNMPNTGIGFDLPDRTPQNRTPGKQNRLTRLAKTSYSFISNLFAQATEKASKILKPAVKSARISTALLTGSRLSALSMFGTGAIASAASAAVAAAGIGYGAGTVINKGFELSDEYLDTNIQETLANTLGKGIAHALAFFGNEAAQSAIDAEASAEKNKAKTQAEAQADVHRFYGETRGSLDIKVEGVPVSVTPGPANGIDMDITSSAMQLA